jgi:hypothetical protein
LLLLPAVPFLHADTLTGEARGGVLDVESKTALPGATMTLLNVDRGWKKQGLTDGAGDYVFVQLEPGNYSVTAEKDGYYSAERTDILIRLNQPKVVIPAFELRRVVSTPTQQITVQGEQPKIAIVDLTTPGPNPTILAYLREPGVTSLATTSDWSLRSNFDSSLIEDLPLRGGRSFDQLSLLSPGVFRVPFTAGEGPAVGIGVGTPGQFSVNGLRSRSNNFTVDGSDNNDEDIGVRRQGFVALVPQTIESVQEFQVMTAGFPAEFGRNSGAMVNAVSRSGQTQVHGNLYGLFNRSGWNAKNPFNPEPRAHTEQYGGVLGGPVVEDRVFYFMSAERQSSRATERRHFVVPTTDERGLRINGGFVPVAELNDFLRDRSISYSALAGQGVFSLYPLPNNPSGPFGQHTYTQAGTAKGNGLVFSEKADWYLSPRHSFAARYNLTDDHSVIPFTSEALNSSIGTDTRTQNISFFLNSTPAPLANALRLSFGRTALEFPPQEGSPLLFGSSPVPQFPSGLVRSVQTPYGNFGPFGATGPVGQVAILPFSRIGVDVYNFPQGRVDNTFQASDFITWTRSSHTVKTGFDIRRSQLNSFSDRNSRPLLLFGYGQVGSSCLVNPLCVFATDDGVLRGTDLAALGAPSGFLQTITTDRSADTTIGLRLTQYDFFVQDNWKLHPNFTINAGARYELHTVPTDVNRRIEKTFTASADQFGHLDPTGAMPLNSAIIRAGNQAFDAAFGSLQSFIAGRKEIYGGDHTNFAPRIGFAWDPKGDGKMAIRGGYGITYDANLGAVTSQSRNVFPTFVPINLDLNFTGGLTAAQRPSGLFLNSPTFFNFIPTQAPLILPNTLNVVNAPPNGLATVLGTLLQQAAPTPGASLSSNGLAFTLPERDYRSSYGQHFVFSVERQLRNDYLVSVAGVSTRGLHLARFATPNAGLISTPVLLSTFSAPLTLLDLPPTVAGATEGRPIHSLGAFTVFQNSATSSYHSLQLSLEKRMSRNVQFRGNWTWSHAIDEVSDPFDARGFYSLPQDGARLDQERASANFDVRHRVSGFAVWTPRQWRLAVVTEFQAGQPFTVNTAMDRNGDGNLTDRLTSTAGLSIHSGEAHKIVLSPGASTLSLVAPRLRNGAVGRNSFRTDGIATVDLAASRRFEVGNSALELRLETFNLFNTTSYGIPIRILESPGFGHAYDLQVNPRTVRISFKVRL